MMRFIVLGLAAALLLAPPAFPAAASEGTSAGDQGGAPGGQGGQKSAAATPQERLAEEVRALKEGLELKQKELGKLRHKWALGKGRNPTEKEVRDFEKKQAQGKATLKDNPYVNHSPLQMIGAAREAYYRKKDEVLRDQERLHQLSEELAALERNGAELKR